MKRTLVPLFVCGILLTCLIPSPGALAAKNLLFRRWNLELDQKSRPSTKQDRVSVSNQKDSAVISIHHRRGIGSAVLRLRRNRKLQRTWPTVRLRFKNFKGLEGLKLLNGKRTISLHDEDSIPSGQHLDLKRKGKGFEVVVPAAFFERGNDLLQVEWVDFYR